VAKDDLAVWLKRAKAFVGQAVQIRLIKVVKDFREDNKIENTLREFVWQECYFERDIRKILALCLFDHSR